MRRNIPLLTDRIYHVYNKSIYGYKIFNTPDEFGRMMELIHFYHRSNTPTSFSMFQRYHRDKTPGFLTALELFRKTFNTTNSPALVRITAYCLMPTHIHLQLQQLMPDGIRIFMQNIQNSYTQYFNNRHNRRGPLWQSRFGNKLIDDDLGLVRNSLYIHANPVKDNLVPSPDQWPYSSYKYFLEENKELTFCDFSPFSDLLFPHYVQRMSEYLTTLRE